MGSLKPLLPWRGVTLVEYQIECLREAGVTEVIVVLGHKADEIVSYVEAANARHVVNPAFDDGRATSIKAGLRQVDLKADGILLLAVDQPRTKELISAVLQAHLHNEALITAPRFMNRGGHPVVFSALLREELESISERSLGVRDVIEAHGNEIHWVETDDPMARLDLNTDQAYQAARRRYGA